MVNSEEVHEAGEFTYREKSSADGVKTAFGATVFRENSILNSDRVTVRQYSGHNSKADKNGFSLVLK